MAQIVYSNDGDLKLGFRPLVTFKKKELADEFFSLVANAQQTGKDFPDFRKYEGSYITNKKGFLVLQNQDGMVVNSFLRKNEWEELDRAIVEAARVQLNAVQHFRDAGLIQVLGGLGTMLSQFNVASDRARPSVNMSGRTVANRERDDNILRSVPIPIIRQDYEIGIRELDASRRMGDGLDVTEAMSTGKAVAEEVERMLFDGNSGIVLGGNGVLGLTNQTGIDTDTATNYGGGDWGTITNVTPTILGMMAALAAKNYYGPFRVYVSGTQYFQGLEAFANKPGNPISEVSALPMIQGVSYSEFLPAGEVLMVQMTRDVVDLAIAMEITSREWRSPDQMAFYGAVMASITPRVKRNGDGDVGIALATAA